MCARILRAKRPGRSRSLFTDRAQLTLNGQRQNADTRLTRTGRNNVRVRPGLLDPSRSVRHPCLLSGRPFGPLRADRAKACMEAVTNHAVMRNVHIPYEMQTFLDSVPLIKEDMVNNNIQAGAAWLSD